MFTRMKIHNQLVIVEHKSLSLSRNGTGVNILGRKLYKLVIPRPRSDTVKPTLYIFLKIWSRLAFKLIKVKASQTSLRGPYLCAACPVLQWEGGKTAKNNMPRKDVCEAKIIKGWESNF